MPEFISELIADYGYFGLFLAMILEAVIVIIPSEAVLATGGVLASRGVFSFWPVFLTGLFGSVFCGVIIYMMGYYGGNAFIKKYGKYFFMKEDDLKKSDSWFQKYGLYGALIGRNLPIIRTLISLPIGIMHLSFWKFLLYTIIGSIPWTFVFVYAGYILGENWVFIKVFVSRLKVPIKIILLVLVVSYFYKKIKIKLSKRSVFL